MEDFYPNKNHGPDSGIGSDNGEKRLSTTEVTRTHAHRHKHTRTHRHKHARTHKHAGTDTHARTHKHARTHRHKKIEVCV